MTSELIYGDETESSSKYTFPSSSLSPMTSFQDEERGNKDVTIPLTKNTSQPQRRFLIILCIIVIVALMEWFRIFPILTTRDSNNIDDSFDLTSRTTDLHNHRNNTVEDAKKTSKSPLPYSISTTSKAPTATPTYSEYPSSFTNTQIQIKTPYNNITIQPNQDLSKTANKIIYIHIGKTGGTTLDLVLKSNCQWYNPKKKRQVKQECFQNLQTKNESQISKDTIVTTHMGYDNAEKLIRHYNISTFLYTVRNPIGRTVSAFNFGHVDNVGLYGTPAWKKDAFYRQCFPTVEDMANVLSRRKGSDKWYTIPKNAKEEEEEEEHSLLLDCYSLAVDHLNGKYHYGPHHLKYNYQFYTETSIDLFPRQKKQVLVLRLEHLWDDLIKLNDLLGGNNSVEFPSLINNRHDEENGEEEDSLDERIGHDGMALHTSMSNTTHIEDVPSPAELGLAVTYGSEGFKVRSGLSDSGKKIMCCYLTHENREFEKIVWLAINLSYEQKQEAILDLYQDCGISSVDLERFRSDEMTDVTSFIDRTTSSIHHGYRLFDWDHWWNETCQ